MKKYLFGALLAVGMMVWQHPAQALDAPSLTLTNLSASAIGDTYIEVQFTSSMDVDNWDMVDIKYNRKGKYSPRMSVTQSYYRVSKGVNRVVIHDLLPDTQYAIHFQTAETSGKILTSKKILATTAASFNMKINNVSATTIKTGDTLTITGSGFGNKSGRVDIGYNAYTNTSITSWSPTKIVAKVTSAGTDGPVIVNAFPEPVMRGAAYAATVSSQDINMASESHSYYLYCWPGVVANTYDEINNFNTLYEQAYGRNIKCDELTFHLQHGTSHDRLRDWLAEQSDASWWSDLKSQYNNKLVFGKRFGMYLMKAGVLYNVPDFTTAAAWGVQPDDAVYIDDLEDHYEVTAQAAELRPWDGPHYNTVIKLMNRQSASFGNSQLDDYFLARTQFLGGKTVGSPDDEVCDYLTCGAVY